MSYDEIFEAAGINTAKSKRTDRFTYADLRRVVDATVEMQKAKAEDEAERKANQ